MQFVGVDDAGVVDVVCRLVCLVWCFVCFYYYKLAASQGF
jgi:hypothetical protein